MKKRMFSLIVLASLLFSLSVYGRPVPFRGKWKDKNTRSMVPTSEPPAASIEGNELSLYFTSAISNLLVEVTDENGMVVYQAIVSEEAGATYLMPLDVSPGVYQLALIHSLYGSLSGIFIVE